MIYLKPENHTFRVFSLFSASFFVTVRKLRCENQLKSKLKILWDKWRLIQKDKVITHVAGRLPAHVTLGLLVGSSLALNAPFKKIKIKNPYGFSETDHKQSPSKHQSSH